VVFVADSQPSAADSNMESMSNLESNLAEMGIDLASFPLVLQYNKRDLPEAAPVAQLRAQLNRFQAPEFETVASRGDGILPALREITRLVVKDLKSRQPHRAPPRPRATGAPSPAPATSAPEAPTRTPAPAAIPAPAATAARALAGGISMARLFGDRGGRVAEGELLVRERAHGKAARRAAEAVTEILTALTTPDPSPAARAALVGLDGRDYLRLGKLATLPDAQVSERDALFALHVLVSAMLRSEGL
jgi:hypothetical protein